MGVSTITLFMAGDKFLLYQVGVNQIIGIIPDAKEEK